MTAAGLRRLPGDTGPVYQELRYGELDASGVRDPTRAPAGTPIPLPFGSQDR